MTDILSTVKRNTRRKASSPVSTDNPISSSSSGTLKDIRSIADSYSSLIVNIGKSKEDVESLYKEITEIKENWKKEQINHSKELEERSKQEEIERRREKETYAYDMALVRKREEDAFSEKKAKWERDLLLKKEELEKEREELEALRKQVTGFEVEKEKAIKEACVKLSTEITAEFMNEKKLREQEIKAEVDLLQLRIENLHTENVRMVKENDLLRKMLDDAQRQLKEIAVRVIESRNTPAGSTSTDS